MPKRLVSTLPYRRAACVPSKLGRLTNLTDQAFVQRDNQGAAEKRSILCVQPRADAHRALGLALETYRVVIVASAFEAIRAMNAAAFDAYVVDYWLADWTGVGLCRHIRKSDPHAPILFFSSTEADLQPRRALRAGATAFVYASDGASALAAALRRALRAADASSLEARVEEERAIGEELRRRAKLEIERSEQARARAAQAIEKAARLRAQTAFLKAGGTLASFDRWWGRAFESSRDKCVAEY